MGTAIGEPNGSALDARDRRRARLAGVDPPPPTYARSAQCVASPCGQVARFASSGAVTVPGSLTCASLEQTSSRELKSAIRPLAERLDAAALLDQLQPVSFRFRREGDSGQEHAGFIAEDTPAELAGGDHRSVRLNDLVAVLTQCVKSQAETIRRHEAEISSLKQCVASLMDTGAR